MPKLVHVTPRYRKHKASGQALVTLSGTDHYLGPHGTRASKRAYDRLVGEWLAGGRAAPATADPNGLSVIELCARYWSHAIWQGPDEEEAYNFFDDIYFDGNTPWPGALCIRVMRLRLTPLKKLALYHQLGQLHHPRI